MKTKWYEHLSSAKDIDNFKKSVHNSKYVLDRLKQICYNIIEETQKSKPIDYEKASWAFEQADKLGHVRALQLIISLLQIDPEEN